VLFNSLEFLFIFLPIVLLVGLRLKGQPLVFWVAFVSSVFYVFAGHVWFLLPMFMTSTLDFWLGDKIQNAKTPRSRKIYLVISLCGSLGLLAYFKYFGLIVDSIQDFSVFLGMTNETTTWLPHMRVILPAGISFYTFQTLSYVIDIYRGHARAERNFTTYISFVSFFPHLVAGPLTRHNQLIPQIRHIAQFGISPLWRAGLFLFFIGLAKKVLIADRIANEIDPMISIMDTLGAFDAWTALLGYACQIYFDFSGYTDMAIGLGRLMQIELPVNFLSPYKAISPSDFWKRWHISLSQWLRDYLYISLGGNQCSAARQRMNLMITMLLGGLWHGASWNFVLWGAYHGLLLLIYHQFKQRWDAMNVKLQHMVTFLCIVLGWVFFRSANFQASIQWFESLFFIHGFFGDMVLTTPFLIFMLLGALGICFLFRNTHETDFEKWPNISVALLGAMVGICILLINYSSKFLYFQF